MRRMILFVSIVLAQVGIPVLQAQTAPTIDDLISLTRVGSPAISPDGRWVAYTVRETNWTDNSYETEIWLAETATLRVRQLTNARKSSSAPAWSPDGTRLAFVSDRDDKRQVYLIAPDGGEAAVVTSAGEGVGAFAWSPDGRSIAYTATDPKPQALEDREKTYGEFEIVDHDYRMNHLWVIGVGSTQPARRLTRGAFTVGRFAWSPDSTRIAFAHQLNGSPASSGTSDISVVSVADAQVHPLVVQPGPDNAPEWSPDGSLVAFETALGSPSFYYTNAHIAMVAAGGGPIEDLTAAFDEDPSLVAWARDGLYFSASAHTWSYLYRLNPVTGTTTRLAPADDWVTSSFSLTTDASKVAFIGAGPSQVPEVFVAPVSTMHPAKLTNMAGQTAGWLQPTREVISWKSRDGVTIEGVLHRPAGFKAGERHPLLVVIHGGPTGVSRAVPFGNTSTYPIELWLAKGALVLEPNYRGSAGYGEKFRSLNVRNLGIGDAWDVVAGIDALVGQELADKDRVGVMGWSQGGYISAFLTTHDSERFKAVSVGAGISDWMTYYVNTDIHPFTRQYLQATPWDDPKIYADTSPITYIKGAKAPTLIQHGEADQRVPPPNAFELYQGLRDRGVETTLIIYKGFGGVGHGPSTPKSSRAVMEHNLRWFNEHIWGEKEGT